MKKSYLHLYVLIVVILLGVYSCEPEEEVTTREFPRLETLDATDITNNGTTFHAKILAKGVEPIMEYGFVWGQFNQLTYEHSAKISVFDDNEVGTYNLKADTSFIDNATYYVKGFLKTEEYIVYGNAMKFTIP